jgi:hypothetical protein
VKKTLKEKMGVGQPKTLIEVLVLATAKFAIVAGMGVGISAGFLWAFTHDQTNVEAQKAWTQDAKELDARIELEKAHPRISF